MTIDNPYRLPRTVLPTHYALTLEPDLDAATFSGEVDIVVTRHVPVVPLPGAGDTNGDNNVDVLDLVTVGSNLGNYYGP